MTAKKGADEVFDLVNEWDEVVGQATRGEVHHKGLRHRAAHILVFDAQGRIFLQKRSMKKDNHPGVWDSSASGHVDAGESYDDSAVRELREEIGLVPVGPLKRLFKINACDATGQEFVWVYTCISSGPFQLDPHEVECGDWFESGYVDQWIVERHHEFAPSFPLIWKKLREATC